MAYTQKALLLACLEGPPSPMTWNPDFNSPVVAGHVNSTMEERLWPQNGGGVVVPQC